jgi:hypothetical protein
MMKKLLIKGTVVFLIFAAFGSVQATALDPVMPELEFSSLEELLDAYQAVKEGAADAELAKLAESVNFLDLDELYVPTNIPDPYQLHAIRVDYLAVTYQYLLEEDRISWETVLEARSQKREFFFGVYRWDPDRSMTITSILQSDNKTVSDLFGGIYLRDSRFGSDTNRLYWGSERVVLFLDVPISLATSTRNMVRFAQLDVVDIETGERTPYSPPELNCGRWYTTLPGWLHWIFRYLGFGWLWMCC